MKTLLLILVLSLSVLAQQRDFPSYDHNGDAKRVKRITPQILATNERRMTNCDVLMSTSPLDEVLGCRYEEARASFSEISDNELFQPLVYLQDDASPTHVLFISATGEYFLTFGIGAIQVTGTGRLRIRGASFTLEDTTGRYRILASGNLSDYTGKVTLNYFAIGNYTIVDRVKQGMD